MTDNLNFKDITRQTGADKGLKFRIMRMSAKRGRMFQTKLLAALKPVIPESLLSIDFIITLINQGTDLNEILSYFSGGNLNSLLNILNEELQGLMDETIDDFVQIKNEQGGYESFTVDSLKITDPFTIYWLFIELLQANWGFWRGGNGKG